MKIDLVYLWCNGNDTKWRERRAKYLKSVDSSDKQSFCAARIADNNDLLYSLRSVEMYAPWVNHIYIVTDDQCPEWLDITNSRVTIVDLKDIFEEEILPLYNSDAIEMGLHKIKGLSEHYLYANDDMMFGRAVTPDFFFTSDGKAKCRVVRDLTHSELKDTYAIKVTRATERIVADFGEEYRGLQPHHNIDAYIKSSVAECLDRYQEWHKQTLKSRFRSPLDIQRHLFTLYSLATGKGVILYKSESRWIKLLQLFAVLSGLKKGFESYVVRISDKHLLLKIRLFKPALLCFNDTEKVEDSDREALKVSYQILYPKKSSFER